MSMRNIWAITLLSLLISSMFFTMLAHNSEAAPFTITVSGNVFDAAGVPAPIGTPVNITMYDGVVITGLYLATVLDSYGFYYNDSVDADNGFNISVNATFGAFFDEFNSTVLAGKASYVIHLGQVIYDVGVSAPADSEGTAGTTITYIFPVTNQGNVKDRYDLSIISQDGWPASIIGSNQTDILMPGESAYINVSVTIPMDVMAGETAIITLQAESVLDPGNIGTATATTTVQLSAGVDVIPLSSASGKPGEAVTMIFGVKNTGNGLDDYHLTSWVDDEEWLFNMEPPIDTGTISPGTLAFVNVTVTIPENSLYDAYTHVTLEAESNSVSSISDQEKQIIETLQVSSSVLSGPSKVPAGHPSGTAIASFSLRNTGNGLDSFMLTAIASPEWTYRITPASLSMLAVLEMRNFTMEIDIPPDAIIGNTIGFTLTASSTNDMTASNTLSFSVEVTDNNAPVAVISSPINNSEFNTSQPIFFNGSASHDPDNDGLSFNWTSSIDGNIGASSYFTKQLSAGNHTITLIVDDGFGGTGQAQIIITLRDPGPPGDEDNDDNTPENIYLLLLATMIIAFIALLIASRTRKKPDPDSEDIESSDDDFVS